MTDQISDTTIADKSIAVTVNGVRRRATGAATTHARRLPPRAVRPDRHPPRLRARRVRRVFGAARRRRGAACLVFAVQADGAEVTTIEGIAGPDGELSTVQAAFRDEHGLQCGFCTPGFVVSVTAFLRDNPDPTDDEIRVGLSGNLCRCTGYQGIINAVRTAATRSNA